MRTRSTENLPRRKRNGAFDDYLIRMEANILHTAANVGFHLRLGALSRCTLDALVQLAMRDRESRGKAFLSRTPLPHSLFFLPEYHYFGAFSLRSFFLLCAVHRPVEKLLKRRYLPLYTAPMPLPSLSTWNSSVVIFNNVYSKLC